MNKITKARLRKHLSIRKVSGCLDLPIPVYLYYELLGVTKLHADVLIDLCALLDIDYHTL